MLLSTEASEFLTRISAKLIYGAIILGAVIGSLSDPLPTSLGVIITVFFSLQAVSVANAYARAIDRDMTERRVTPWREKTKDIFRPGWIMGSTVVPITFFALSLLGLMTQDAALAATKITLVVLLLFFGTVARRLSGARLLPSLAAGAMVALLGYAVVQIKLWTKYLPSVGY